MLKRSFNLIILFIVSIGLAADVNVSLDGNNLMYNASTDIAGFQFAHDGCVVGASGGDAAANGFTVTSSATTVLGFSFTGAVIPDGEGILVSLDGGISDDCLYNFVFSGPGGVSLSVEFGDDSDPVCDDIANDEICDDEDDCVGDYDECGVCNGDGIADGALSLIHI